MSVKRAIEVYLHLVSASIREQMQYKASFAVRTFTDFLVVLSDFAPIWFLVERFGILEGWTFAELALLYGMVGASWGVVEATLYGFHNFGPALIEGRVDRWLLRPVPVAVQIASADFQLRKLGRISQASLIGAIACWYLGLGPASLAWIAIGLTGGVLFFSGIVLASAGTQFWTLGHTEELQNMLTYGGTTALAFPLSIYATWFRRVLMFGVPMAFVNYFPALAALGRLGEAGWPAWVAWISPAVCLAMLIAGLLLYSAGLRRYESTGS